jgi:uncharacterized membrane protein YedE/YeeE
MHLAVLIAAAAATPAPQAAPTVHVNPNPAGLPGTEVLQGMLDGLAFWGLLAAVAGIVLGAIVWAIASHSNNHHWATKGRGGAMGSALAALVVGGAGPIVNFFIDLGGKIK